ncbi:MAG TPA: trehalase family glycosidase [Patescibacteria group bacterium]|jgi:hypothetical protein|nr:trehalase family glycosidase [Patescibacteria group bacterium]
MPESKSDKQTESVAAKEISDEPDQRQEPETLETRAKAVLKNNDKGLFTIPAEGIYPHQWLWDSCFISIGMRHYDIERAKLEIFSILKGQWSNGMVPHMVLNPIVRDDRGKRLRDSRVWRSWLNPYSPDDISTSGITQPPILAEAIVRIGEKMRWPERRTWYKSVFPALVAYHKWLYDERDPHQEGLTLQIHPWETGLDNTPPWMSELHDHLLPFWIRSLRKTRLDVVFGWFRSDVKYAPLEQRESNTDALALYDIQRRFRRKQYDFDRIINHSLFAIEDLTFNSILARANSHLVEIAKALREELPPELVESIKKTESTFEQLWDPISNEYFSRDFVTHRPLKQTSIAALMPLYSGVLTKDRAEILVKMLESEHIFGPAYPVPSVPLNSPWFNPVGYWQGPVWINTNWLIIDGLRRYGFNKHANALQESTLELIEKYGFYEYFNPLTGEPAGVDNFSWTAALAIDLMH